MKRRGFLAALAAVPFLRRLAKAAPVALPVLVMPAIASIEKWRRPGLYTVTFSGPASPGTLTIQVSCDGENWTTYGPDITSRARST